MGLRHHTSMGEGGINDGDASYEGGATGLPWDDLSLI